MKALASKAGDGLCYIKNKIVGGTTSASSSGGDEKYSSRSSENTSEGYREESLIDRDYDYKY